MRNELVTTNKLESAMAPAAYIGDSNPITAIGMPTMLYAKAQPRLTRIVLRVRFESFSASNTARGSVRISVMSALETATSVPVPIAILTSAPTSAAASLMPSPTITTVCD